MSATEPKTEFEWLEDEYIGRVRAGLKAVTGRVHIQFTAFDCWMIVFALQVASKHPDMGTEVRGVMREIGDSLTGPLIHYVPEIKPLIEDGWINAGTCRICGCTDEQACLEGCSWVEADLCSRCAAPVIFAADGTAQ